MRRRRPFTQAETAEIWDRIAAGHSPAAVADPPVRQECPVLNSVSSDTYRRVEVDFGPTLTAGPEPYRTLYSAALPRLRVHAQPGCRSGLAPAVGFPAA